ncbi:sugar ABC transporter substrate-binding protein [Dorea formicigenerans]|jgi:multiple sugar transport system substrate-binding protein|uniref:Sugar ABC transporter substrate-binding protein n=1 Tax=Dorea formicigenerans TaxID=39486 RepID=A0A3E5ET37_9FIRM|nr:sugar ABC transporter substrate-binding protein [Dorea formicigenerans]RGJ62999.1 sugar ABC transporter substrate-binding protein [Dorea formicigenerans]RGN92129.1 sugar ABC transporter substrate-binding protein [Dorea formicigenerans]RGT41629.1 sugar ABC transporter substrate-binding protein [Dorea formicigenerans]RHC50665.1 sugar ABC transporter substrate-binding protein [Dorea formicigenerans]RHF78844.1 sugar ABC transporter substrate-binding protein [Dorea formicigenerans]
MKKKIVSVLLVAAMAVSMFTGCGSKSDSKKSDSKSGEKTLEVWVPPLDDATEKNWGDLLKDWEKEKDCKVNLTVIPWDKYEETYTTALNSGEGPDVGYMYNEMFPTYIDAGAVEDMSSYVTDEDKKEYKYLSNGNMMDGQYGWPLVTGVPFVLYYNEDILNALGEKAPETWDDFARICQEATKDTDGDGKVDQYGFACGMNTSDIGAMQILNAYYYSALWQNGGQVYNDDLKSVSFADEAGKEAVTWLKGLTSYMNEDFMSLSWSDAFSNVFGAGKAAFGITRSSQTDGTTFAETYPDLNWNFVTSLKNKDFGTFGATDCLTLMSACEDKDLAMDFIKYVTGSEFMTAYHAKCPGAALTESEPYVGDEKMEKIYTEDKDKWHGIQAGPCGTQILNQLAADFQGIMSGETSVDEGLKEAEDYANGLLDEYWANK